MSLSLPPGTLVAGRYAVQAVLGSGATAVVYRAFDSRLRLDVALKVMAGAHANTHGFAERLGREGRTLARLNHPNILRLYDIGEDPRFAPHYLVLEYLAGGTLYGRMSGRPWPVADVVQLLRPLAAGLDYAHSLQPSIVHRDLKPANIMFAASGRPVICDFGLIRILGLIDEGASEATLTSTRVGTVLGTPSYMSPEQAIGERIGPASDRYSLGVVAYELLVGKVPFKGDSPLGTLLRVVNDPLPMPRQINPALRPAVEQVLVAALAREPSARFATSGAFVDALERAGVPSTSGATRPRAPAAPPTVAPPAAPTRTARVPRRRLVGVLGLLVLMACIAGGLLLWGPAQLSLEAPRLASQEPSPPAAGNSTVESVQASPQPSPQGRATVAAAAAAAAAPIAASPGPTRVPEAALAKDYAIRKDNVNAAEWPAVQLPPASANTRLAVDAQLVSTDPRGELIVSCRAQNIGTPNYAAYQLLVIPRWRAFVLKLRQGSNDTFLGGLEGVSFTSAIAEADSPDHMEHLELVCVGDAIVARINNQIVAAAHDSRLRDGGQELSAGGRAGVAADARFRNLLVMESMTAPVPAASRTPVANQSQFDSVFPRAAGELRLAKDDASRDEFPGVFTSEDIADVSLTVDARVAEGDDERAGINLSCRIHGRTWYQLTIIPGSRSFELKRRDAGNDTPLVPRSLSDALPDRHSSIQASLRCIGDTISVRLNGRTVAAVHDSTYASGKVIVQANGPAGTPTDVRFTRVKVLAEAPGNADAAPPVAEPGTVLIADAFADADVGWLLRKSLYTPGITLEYVDGTYRMARPAGSPTNYATASLAGSYADVSLVVDAQILSGALELKCRAGEGAWYVWHISSEERSYWLARTTGQPSPETVALASANNVAILAGLDKTRHFDLSCVGNVISATLDGVRLALARDDALKAGRIDIQAGGLPGPTEARLTNLTLVQR